MNASELRRYENLLLGKQEQLWAEFDTKVLVPASWASDGDMMDHARADAEADLQISLRQVDNQTLREIEAALARISRGTFGQCEVCGEPLSKARLQAVPWAAICRQCKDRIA